MNVLNITDGADLTVNLLNLTDGFSVDDWRQRIAQYKGGGTWSQSALTDGNQLVAKAFDNIVEEIPIPGVVGAEADIAAAALATVLFLLEKASNYWTDDWRNEPVWLESQSDCETNKQYALIYSGGFPDLGDPYSHEYLANAVLTDLMLRIVRDHWGDNPPKVGTALPISVVETWDGRNLGNVDIAGDRVVTTAAEVYSVNKQGTANITHAFHVDNEVVDVWVGNMMDFGAGAYPFGLFPAGVAVGDFLVIGIECAGAPYYPFSNVIFDIDTANVNIETIWEYWDGADPWGALSPFDNTDTVPAVALDVFTETGVNGVWWDQPDDWVLANLNTDIFGAPAPNVDGYWVRCRVTGLGGAATIPTQQNRDIYSCIWPYIEVQSADVEGHIDAILKLLTEARSDGDGTGDNIANRVIGGLRSDERGDGFAAFINLGNAQNPPGVTVTISDGVRSSIQGGTENPAYYYWRYAPAADNVLTGQINVAINHITIGSGDFYGTFRVFLRCKQVGGAVGDIGVQLSFHNWFLITSDVKYTSQVGQLMLLDFGELTIPHTVPMELLDPTNIAILCSNTNAPTADLYGYELILMPIDEFAFDVSVESTSAADYVATYADVRLEVDSIIDPKRLVRTLTHTTSTSELRAIWQTIAGDRLKFHPHKTQRYWFVYERFDEAGEYYEPEFWIGARSQMQATQRYLGRRGAG